MLWIYVRRDLFCVNHLLLCNFWGCINCAYVKPRLITIYWQPVKFGFWQQCRRRQIKLENMSKGLWQCFWKTYLMDDPLTKYFKYPQGIINTIFLFVHLLFLPQPTLSAHWNCHLLSSLWFTVTTDLSLQNCYLNNGFFLLLLLLLCLHNSLFLLKHRTLHLSLFSSNLCLWRSLLQIFSLILSS